LTNNSLQENQWNRVNVDDAIITMEELKEETTEREMENRLTN
jgi:hypothetical protein